MFEPDKQAPDFQYQEGDSPVILTLPHVGRALPKDVSEDMSRHGREMPDNDQHLDTVWNFAADKGVSVLASTWSRYVVDLNRDPKGRELYEGMDNTELCPLLRYDNEKIYNTAAEPNASEVFLRTPRYWQPFHSRLITALTEKRKQHGYAVLIDAHSIRSEVPRLFDGRLPDINIGTNDGRSTDPGLTDAVMSVLHSDGERYSSILNGRFIGGFITRHYGNPNHGMHALQVLLSKRIYMQEEPPYALHAGMLQRLQPLLSALLDTVLDWHPPDS